MLLPSLASTAIGGCFYRSNDDFNHTKGPILLLRGGQRDLFRRLRRPRTDRVFARAGGKKISLRGKET